MKKKTRRGALKTNCIDENRGTDYRSNIEPQKVKKQIFEVYKYRIEAEARIEQRSFGRDYKCF